MVEGDFDGGRTMYKMTDIPSFLRLGVLDWNE